MSAHPLLLASVVLLAGCTTPPEPTFTASGDGPHVLVVGGTVVESGPEPNSGDACDVAAPPFSADDDQHRIWYVPTTWHDADPREADLAVVRVDRTEWRWDDDCWVYGLQALNAADNLRWWHDEVPQTVPVRLTPDGVEVDGVLLRPGEETEWDIDVSCQCTQHGVEGTYRYQGTLHVRYMGTWDVEVTDFDGLPPLDVPYWDGWD